MDDPRLAQYSDAEKREIISQIAAQTKADPDTMVEERCAMTTRVANSFVRIGHLDLFARRVERVQASLEEKEGASSAENTAIRETREYQELEDMMWHACYREYYEEAYEPYFDKRDVKGAALALMERSMCKIADMVAGWVRVGFVQGNFNADNCLVGGRTMDYGPFVSGLLLESLFARYHHLCSYIFNPLLLHAQGFLDVYVSHYFCVFD